MLCLYLHQKWRSIHRLSGKKNYQRSLETRINLLYRIYPDRKHCFGIEKKQIYRFKMVYFSLGRYCTNQLISLSEFPVVYETTLITVKRLTFRSPRTFRRSLRTVPSEILSSWSSGPTCTLRTTTFWSLLKTMRLEKQRKSWHFTVLIFKLSCDTEFTQISFKLFIRLDDASGKRRNKLRLYSFDH